MWLVAIVQLLWDCTLLWHISVRDRRAFYACPMWWFRSDGQRHELLRTAFSGINTGDTALKNSDMSLTDMCHGRVTNRRANEAVVFCYW